MPRYRVHTNVDPASRRAVSGALLRRWSETVLDALAVPDAAVLEIAVTGDEQVRALNHAYRGLDEPTDVLSFPFGGEATPAPFYGEGERDVPDIPFPLPPGSGRPLGEIVISFPYAERQAAAEGRPVRAEVALLLVHGILHLMGYDHLEPGDERIMTARTQELLERLGPSAL